MPRFGGFVTRSHGCHQPPQWPLFVVAVVVVVAVDGAVVAAVVAAVVVAVVDAAGAETDYAFGPVYLWQVVFY